MEISENFATKIRLNKFEHSGEFRAPRVKLVTMKSEIE